MSDHSRREQLIGQLRSISDEAAGIRRAPQADHIAKELLQLIDNGPPDFEALSAIGWYHWLRQCTLPQKQASSDDWSLTFQTLAPCLLLGGDLSDLPATALSMVAEYIDDPLALLKKLGVDSDLLPPEEVAALWFRMVVVTPSQSPHLALRLAELHHVTAELEDGPFRTEILRLLTDGVMRLSPPIPPTHPSWPLILHVSCKAALLRYSSTQHSSDLDLAIDRARQALDLITKDHPLWTENCMLLGSMLVTRTQHVPESLEVSEALRILTELDATLDREDPSRPVELSHLLGIAQMIGALHGEDFTAALAALDRMDLDEAPELATQLNLLADIQTLADNLDDTDSQAKLEPIYRRFLTVFDGSERWEVRLTLSWLLLGQVTGREDPRLDEAIELLEANMTEASDPETVRRSAQRLAMALQQRFDLRDDPADLDRGRRLADEFGSDTSPAATRLKSRFIKLMKAPSDIRPADVFDSDFRFNQDADHLTSIMDIMAFSRTALQEQAITGGSVAAEAISDVTEILLSISDVSDPAPLDDMIASMEATIARLPGDSGERPFLELFLLNAQGMRAALANDAHGTAEFVRLAHQALANDALSPGVRRTMHAMVSEVTKLGAMWEVHHDGRVSAETKKGAEQSAKALLAMSLDETGTASQRIDAARRAAELAHRAGNPTAAAAPLAVAVALLSEAAPWHVRPDRRRRHFRRFTGLTSEAVALTLAHEESDRANETALRLMEAGRGVLHQQIIGSRSDQPELHRVAPELAEEYKSLISQLSQDDSAPDDDAEPEWRHLAAESLKQVKAQIRQIDGFAEFGGLPPIEQLRDAAAEGPIVAINLSRHGCHALIVRPEGVERVPLRQVNLTAATRYVNQFVMASSALYADPAPSFDEFQRYQDTIREVLSWVHKAITGPVLDYLDYEPTAPGSCPRMWWAPGGMLGLLPLHAAGDYSLERPVITADRVVSSYTPTIGQLRHVRAAQRGGPTAPRGFAVAMPNTPSQPPLPEAPAEVAALRAIWPQLIAPEDVLIDGQTDRDAIVNRLKRMELAHFACHATTDPTDPAAGRILLDDYVERPLTVEQLSLLDIPNGRLAYLSACRTAHSSDGAMLDESLHLAAACQVGGFSHVIGTLWPVADDIAAGFAAACYRAMANTEAELDPNLSARAVHQAMNELRGKPNEKSPHLWAPWVHYGAL
ncbi:CHAT domain-containing protein [Stackebrandtia endophytica]|uniref:CHAT domain-containing protein n=1 Tax=Stackebrandtia endophytica TaxID=1496996 RepID=A0A543AUT6_9ACTN|nr:CHAT domain-containing protein [Stackebrandtia endophytica]TQL76340.1 CHAT domain-containing protein [Stackebrandtia endophytica]